jgi:uncharacterized integral membrane protein
MKILSIFLWIIVGAVILWFFTNNIEQKVDIHFFQITYTNIHLIIIIFISFFIGAIVGAILLSAQLLKSRSEIRSVKKENLLLLKELDGLRNLSIDELPEADTQIGPSPTL